MKPPLCFFASSVVLTLGLVHPTTAFTADPECEVNVNTTLTEAGRKVAPPSREHPAYYFPVVAGWREEGAVVAGEHPPPRALVTKQLAKTLAEQGYLVVGAKTPPPSLLLVFHWGCLNPQIDDLGSVDSPQKIFFNQREMLALVGGTTLNRLDLEFEREAVMQGAEEDRYFMLVTAYDFADAQQKKKTVLWRARMSTPSAGRSMDEVVAALVKSGGPLFGRETVRPQWISAPVAQQGHVEVGTATVVPEAPATPATTAGPEKK